MDRPSPKKNQVILIIDYETLDTDIYNGDGENLHIEGEIDHSKDGRRSITVNLRIDLDD